VVSPIVSPHNLAKLESVIRERANQIFDALPVARPSTGSTPSPSS